jgi:uncharacterized protein (TIGR00730 family)
MRVSVFGGSSPKPEEIAYDDAYRLGRLLGEEGYIVFNGGYIGTMEAVSRGTVEAGGRTIGVTCDQIEAWRPLAPNIWIQEEMRFETVRERLNALIDYCDAALVLPGGIGTLAEVAAMWSQLQTNAITPRRLILIGAEWKKVMDKFMGEFNEYVPDEYRRLVEYAATVDDVIKMLKLSNE